MLGELDVDSMVASLQEKVDMENCMPTCVSSEVCLQDIFSFPNAF